ncbi:MAG: MFS transporter [Bacteroidota bacterium]|nr:MFS transporter [Bacteroidota bacterium]
MIGKTIQIYKESFSGLQPSIWLLSLLQLINRSGTMVVPFMSMYMTQHLGVSISKAGLVMMFFGVGSILGAILGGKLTDKFGYYYVTLFTLLGGGLVFIVLGFIKTYVWICVVTFILALVNEAFRPANMSAIGVFSTAENRTRSSSLVRLSVNLGWAVGASVGGWIAAHNYQLLFWVDGITNLLACIFVLLYLPNIRLPKIEPTFKKQTKASSVFKDRTFMYFIGLKLFFAICFFQVFTTLPVYLKTVLNLSETQIGTTMALNGLLIALFEMVIVSQLQNRRSEFVYMIQGTLLVGLSFIMFNLFQMHAFTLAIIASIIITVGEILAMPFMLSWWLNRSNDSNRGQYAAWYTTAFACAHIVGPALGGFIADAYGFHILWWSVGVVCVLTSYGYYKLQKREPAVLASYEDSIPIKV